MLAIKNKSLLSDSFWFSISNGLNRGALLIIFPIILFFFGTEQYGQFSLIWSIMQLLSVVLCLSGTTAVVREGTTNQHNAKRWTYIFYSISTFIFAILVLTTFYLMWSTSYRWVCLSLILSLPNALILLRLSELRTLDGVSKYFRLSVLKLSFLVLIVLFTGYFIESFFALIISISIGWMLLWFIESKFSFTYLINNDIKNIKPTLKYCLFVIPHSISIWALSSSDKVIIKEYLDDYQLGIYSISYSIALVIVVITSGFSIAFPKYLYRNPEVFSEINNRNKLLIAYAGLSILLTLILIFALRIEKEYVSFIDSPDTVKDVFSYSAIGIMFFGISQIYSSYLFYYRRTAVVAMASSLSAFFNIALNFILIPEYGIEGAAIATLVSYILYSIFIYLSAVKVHKPLQINFVSHSIVFVCVSAFSFLFLMVALSL